MTKDGDYYRALSMLYALHNQPKYDKKLIDDSVKPRYKTKQQRKLDEYQKAKELNDELNEETKQKLEEND